MKKTSGEIERAKFETPPFIIQMCSIVFVLCRLSNWGGLFLCLFLTEQKAVSH